MLKSGSNHWGISRVLVALSAAAVLVFLVAYKPSKSSQAGGLVSSREAIVKSPKKCVMDVTSMAHELASSEPVSTWREHIRLSADGVLSTVNQDGTLKKERLAQTDFESIPGLTSRVKQTHKFAQMGDARVMMFPDNTVLTLDTRTCEIDGVYGPTPEGEVNPNVWKIVRGDLAVLQDKKKKSCTKEKWNTCRNKANNKLCRSKQKRVGQRNNIRYQISCPYNHASTGAKYECGCGTNCPVSVICGNHCNSKREMTCKRKGMNCWTSDTYNTKQRNRGVWKPRCPSGWSDSGSKTRQCGCGQTCNGFRCSNYKSQGSKCDLNTNHCKAMTELGPKMVEAQAAPVKEIQSAVNVAVALLKFPGPKVGNPTGLVGAFMGILLGYGASSPSPSPASIYNTMLTKVGQALSHVEACIDVKLTQYTKDEINEVLHTLETNLNPDYLAKGTSTTVRADYVFNPNANRCEDMGSRFQIIKGRQYYTDVLPLAVKVMELCTANYLGWLRDEVTAGGTRDDIVSDLYRTMARQILDSVTYSIEEFDKLYKQESYCGFFPNDKTLLQTKLTYLRDNVETPVRLLKEALDAKPTR